MTVHAKAGLNPEITSQSFKLTIKDVETQMQANAR